MQIHFDTVLVDSDADTSLQLLMYDAFKQEHFINM